MSITRRAVAGAARMTEEVADHGLHTRAGEKRRGIIFGQQRSRGENRMSPVLEKFEILCADFLCVHIVTVINLVGFGNIKRGLI